MKKEKYISEVNGKYLRIKIRTDDGCFSKTVTIADFPTKASAMEYAKRIRDEALVDKRNNRLILKSPTVGTLYQKSFDLFGYSLKTWQKHEAIYRDAISQFANIEIADVKTADIMESVTQYAQTHTDDSIERLISVWHSIYQTAQMMDVPVSDKTMAVKRMKPVSKVPTKKRAVEVTDAEIQAFLEAVREYGDGSKKALYTSNMVEMLVLLLLHTGCRPGEALALTVSDINLAKNEISINKEIGSTHTVQKYAVRSTKTQQSIRKVPISPALKDILTEYLHDHKYDLIFCDYYGNPMDVTDVGVYMNHVSKKCGIHVTLYMLRHKFSTDMIKVTDLRTVQDLMGHESSNMTLSYARSTKEDREKAVQNRVLS